MIFLSLKNFDQNMTYMLCQEEREQELMMGFMIQIGAEQKSGLEALFRFG